MTRVKGITKQATQERTRKPSASKAPVSKQAPQYFIPSAERREQGKSRRAVVPRQNHADWSPSPDRRDPIDVLEESNVGRIAELIPIRYGRMMKSPFTFFRGSAAVMAMDLASTDVTHITAQLCGDCHLLNFGAYATPERNMIVDINDFDETLPGPWEWDLKRLATSFVLAGRDNRFSAADCKEAAELVSLSYRTAMREFSEMTALEVWYSKMDVDDFLGRIKDKNFLKDAQNFLKKAKEKSDLEILVPKLTVEKDGRRVFLDNPPLLYHTDEQREVQFLDFVANAFDDYKSTLNEARRVLLDRYTLVDTAIKVVGIGSVGTTCGVLLLMSDENDPLVLQLKEAGQSILEPYVGKGKHSHQGHRVVEGQRLMQSHSDIFLGWTKGPRGRDFYIRQLRDMKMSPIPELWTSERMFEVADAFGWILARAHARSGDPAIISGYLGSKDIFDKAIADFAERYADQTELDHKALLKAVRSGRLEASLER